MEPDANPLEEYFYKNDGPLLHKWLHYFDIYDRHFSPYRGKEITMVEIGVFHGGSMAMWSEYFGPQAKIIGVDISERAKQFESDNVQVFIGDQEDPVFLNELLERIGPIDVLLDDGGHTVGQQLVTFRELWPAIKPGGIAMIEDLHSNYWQDFGGGYRKPGTFIEFAKTLIDSQNAWHSHEPDFQVDDYSRTVTGFHSYDSVIVVEKGDVPEPQVAMTGKLSFERDSSERLKPIANRSKGEGDPSLLVVDIWKRFEAALDRSDRAETELRLAKQTNAESIREIVELRYEVGRLTSKNAELNGALTASRAEVSKLRKRLPDRVLRKVRGPRSS